MDHPLNPNPSFPFLIGDLDLSEFINFSDYVIVEEDDDVRELPVQSPTVIPVPSLLQTVEGKLDVDVDVFVDHATTPENANNINQHKMKKKKKKDDRRRVAFRTKSEMEIMDDGYRWRKYGKKSVKNSPNPRNYYRCSSVGCQVKKRVQRDGEDQTYVITTYEGVHNHPIPYNYSSNPNYSSIYLPPMYVSNSQSNFTSLVDR